MTDEPKSDSGISIDTGLDTFFENLPSEVKTAIISLRRVLRQHNMFLITAMIGLDAKDGGIDGAFYIPRDMSASQAALFGFIAETAKMYHRRLSQ